MKMNMLNSNTSPKTQKEEKESNCNNFGDSHVGSLTKSMNSNFRQFGLQIQSILKGRKAKK